MRTPQELSDQAEIRDALTAYFVGLDRRDWDLVKDCFTPNCQSVYHGCPVNGTEALIRMIRGVERYRVTMHFMGNTLIQVHGEAAVSQVYAEAHLLLPISATEERDRINGLRYLDDWVRIEGRWKIHHRVQIRDWNRNDIIPALEPPRSV